MASIADNRSVAESKLVEVKRICSESGQPEFGIALELRWSDGLSSRLDSKQLRSSCPCATCLEARGDRSHAKPLAGRSSLLKVITHNIDEQLDLKQVWPIGNYALGLLWGDEHDSGIYTYKLLRSLCAEQTD